MKLRAALIVCEAVVGGGPSTAAFVYGCPVLFGFAVSQLLTAPVTAAFLVLTVLGCAWALTEFWRLSLMTAQWIPYRFGIGFWFAVLGAALGTWQVLIGMPVIAVTLFASFPAAVVAHFAYLQWRRVAADAVKAENVPNPTFQRTATRPLN